MAWTTEVRLDPGKATVGSLTATWNAGEIDEWSGGGRFDMADGSSMDKLVTEIRSRRTKVKTSISAETTLAAKVAAALNAAETKEV